jgi:hypothetical protein
MYYEERIINEVLHFRSTPKGPWEAVSPERLTEMLIEARKESMVFQEKGETLSRVTADHLEPYG